MYYSPHLQITLNQTNEALQAFLKIISDEKKYLDKLLSMENANPNTKKLQEDKVNKLWYNYNVLVENNNFMLNELTNQYEQGKKMGQYNAEQLYKKKDSYSYNKYLDKEAYRAQHEFKTKEENPNLF